MKKIMMTALVATMASGSISAFAGAAGKAAQEVGQAAEAATSAIKGAGAAGVGAAKVTAGAIAPKGQDQKSTDISGQAGFKASAVKGVAQKTISAYDDQKVGGNCSLNSAFAKAPEADRRAIQEAVEMGIGGDRCASSLDSTATVAVLAAGDQAALDAAKKLGIKNADELRNADKATLGKVFGAMTKAIAKKLNISIEEAKARLLASFQKRCDFVSEAFGIFAPQS